MVHARTQNGRVFFFLALVGASLDSAARTGPFLMFQNRSSEAPMLFDRGSGW